MPCAARRRGKRPGTRRGDASDLRKDGAGHEWKAGETVRIVPGRARGSGRAISVTYPALLSDVTPGAEIQIDDGRVRTA
jgi:pyruvate kinase